MMLTHLFDGTVCLRNVDGEIHQFLHRDYWTLLVTSTWTTPTLELAPGDSHAIRHPLSEFIDWTRTDDSRFSARYADRFALLSDDFAPGCELWCVLDIREMKRLSKWAMTRKTGMVRSPSLIDFKPPMFGTSGKAYRRHPYFLGSSPLLTHEEQQEGMTEEEIYDMYQRKRVADRQKYPLPLRALVEARQTPDDSSLVVYKRALSEIRANPPPELFRQFAEWIHEGTREIEQMVKHILFGISGVQPWDEDRRQTALRALIDALPYVKTNLDLEDLLVVLLSAQGGGVLKLNVPETSAYIDLSVSADPGSYSSGSRNISGDLLLRAAEECQKALRDRYPELR